MFKGIKEGFLKDKKVTHQILNGFRSNSMNETLGKEGVLNSNNSAGGTGALLNKCSGSGKNISILNELKKSEKNDKKYSGSSCYSLGLYNPK